MNTKEYKLIIKQSYETFEIHGYGFCGGSAGASCSQDDYLAEDGGDTPVTGQTQTYTFTVSPDIVMEGDARTRSEGTDAEKPTRCFMQVFDSDDLTPSTLYNGTKEGDSYTFTVTLASDKSYDYCFYADNDNYRISDLNNITWPNTGDVVAYAHVLSGKSGDIETSVTLKHIVTKITLKHIGSPFTVAAGEEFKISFPCANTFDVLNNAASTGNGYEDFTYTFAEGKTINDGDEVCSFYTIVPYQVENNPDITLNLHQLTQTISSIEWKINSHVTLQGDLSEDNPKWGATSEYVQKQIDFFFKKEDGTSEGTLRDFYYFYLPPGNIADLEAVLSAIFHKNVELNLTQFATIFYEVLDNDYTFAVSNNTIIMDLTIYINDSVTYVIRYDASYSADYENFSVVSNKLNQSTE